MIAGVLLGATLVLGVLVPGAYASSRIVGGKPARQGHWPFMAFIVYFNRDGTPKYACSGTLVSSNVVLTAGHCVASLTTGRAVSRMGFRVFTGAVDWTNTAERTVRRVSKVIVDPHFDPSKIRHDDGLLVLARPVRQRPVAMWRSSQVKAGTAAEIAGWGSTYGGGSVTTHLRWADTVVKGSHYCSRPFYRGFHYDPSSQLCAIDSPTDATATCHGDSGGPLLVRGSNGEPIEVGVTSVGQNDCSTRWPDYFTAVGPIEPWIRSKIKAAAPSR